MLDKLTRAALLLAGLGVLLMMLLIVVDVLAKYLLNSPIPGVLELVAFYFMIMVVFLPLAYAQQSRQHLFIDLFTRSLAPRTTASLDAVAGIISLVYLGLFAGATFRQALYMTAINHSAEILTFDLILWPTLWVLPASILLMMSWVACHTWQHLVLATRPVDGKGSTP